MGISRPLRPSGTRQNLAGVLLVYELVRLLTLIGVFVYLEPAGRPFPWLAALAPNALFPLMALFFRIDGSFLGAAYAPLYMAGKVVSVVTALNWFVFFSGLLRPAEDSALFFMNGEHALAFLGGALFITAGDLFSIAGGLLFSRKLGTGRQNAGLDLDEGAE